MIDLLARKSSSGDIFVNLADQYLSQHEWGRARMALEEGLGKGRLTNLEQVQRIREEVFRCLDIAIQGQ